MIHNVTCKLPSQKTGDCGWWKDTEVPRTYHTVRSHLRGQIFNNPKFRSAVGLNVDILKKCIQYKITDIKMQIIGFEKESFYITIKVDEFIKKSDKVNYGYGEQRILSMGEFLRVYPGQTKL